LTLDGEAARHRFESHLPSCRLTQFHDAKSERLHIAPSCARSKTPLMMAWFERAGCWEPPSRWSGTARLYRGMSLTQTPPGLPLTRRSPRRGSLVGGSRRGSTLSAKVRQAERCCPRERACLVHVWSTCHRSRAVRNGLQGSPALGRSRRLPARSCGNRPRGRTLIRMRPLVQVQPGPLHRG
jgi:hypothetical protein